MKPIRLLSLIEASTITGPAKNLLQFAQNARDADPAVEVTAVVFRRTEAPSPFMQRARSLSIPVFTVRESGRFDSTVRAQLRALAREIAPDLVQSHAVKSHFLTRLAGLHRLAPWIAFHHGYTWPDMRMRLYNRLDRWSLPSASRVVTVSLPFREELIRAGVAAGRIEVIHNAVAPDWGSRERFREMADKLRESLGIGGGKAVILAVGRLSREKDHQSLLRALRVLKEERGAEAPRLLIVGDGPERPAIEGAIRALDLAADVTLTGQVPSAEPYYAIADIAVLPSLTEGSPNALLEAMAAGVPVVATAVGGVPEIVSHEESALLVASADWAAMARALRVLLDSKGLGAALAERARRLALTCHSPQSRANRLLRLYTSVLSDQLSLGTIRANRGPADCS